MLGDAVLCKGQSSERSHAGSWRIVRGGAADNECAKAHNSKQKVASHGRFPGVIEFVQCQN